MTALVTGSMIPDFEYFMRMKVYSIYSHSAWGLLYFDLPVGLVIYYLFIKIIRAPLITHLPDYLRKRFSIPFTPLNNAIIISSLFIGAVSHLVWDSFTHSTGYFVQLLAVLQESINIGPLHVILFKLLQHGSTFIGIFVLMMVIVRMPGHTVYFSGRNSYYWPIVLIFFLTIMVTKFLMAGRVSLADFVVAAISAGLMGILLASIYDQTLNTRS
jgi:hypothetical protein